MLLLFFSLSLFFSFHAGTSAQTLNARYEIIGDSEGCTGTTVTFRNTSTLNTGEIEYVKWSFGDGRSYTSNELEENIEHTYDAPGQFTAILEIKETDGLISKWAGISGSDTLKVRISEPPVVDFSFPGDRHSCSPNQSIPVTEEVFSSGDVDIIVYEWLTSEGGNPDFGKSASLSFTSGGYKDITLKVRDAYGCERSITKNNAVYASNITPSFSTDALDNTACIYNGYNDKAITINNLSTGSDGFDISNTTWEFPGGSVYNGNQTGSALSLTYSSEGSKTVSATMENEISYTVGGENYVETCEVSGFIDITVQKPVAGFSSDTAWVCSYPVAANLLADDYPTTVQWDWTLATGTRSGKTVSHAFNREQDTLVTLMITTKYGCKDQKRKSAFESRHAEIILEEDTTGGCKPLLVNFNGTLNPVLDNQNNPVGNTTSWHYVFERETPYVSSPKEYNLLDEQTLPYAGTNTSIASFDFDEWGNHRIKLYVENDICGIDSTNTEVMVGDSIKIDFRLGTPDRNWNSGTYWDTCFNCEIPFLDLSYGAEIIPTTDSLRTEDKAEKYGWLIEVDYGDSTTPDVNLIEYTHRYLQSDDEGLENDTYPGNQRNLFRPTEIRPGEYNIAVTATHYGCETFDTIPINLRGPLVYFTNAFIEGCDTEERSRTYQFKLKIYDADQLTVYWGDGEDQVYPLGSVVEEDSITIQHTYNSITEAVENFYVVAENTTQASSKACRDTARLVSSRLDNDIYNFCVDTTPSASFMLASDTVCYNKTIEASSTSSDNATSFLWNLESTTGDKPIEDLSTDMLSLATNQRGIYTLTLEAGACNECSEDIDTTVYILKPHADFNATRTGICPGETVLFEQEDTTVSPTTDYVRWEWHFGDGETAIVTDSSSYAHSYNEQYKDNKFTPRLIVTDAKNCVSQSPDNDYLDFIRIHIPKTNLSSNIQTVCNNTQPVTVTAFNTHRNSGVNLDSIFLDMGDGKGEHFVNPSSFFGQFTYRYHINEPEGWGEKNYVVTSRIVDKNGCTETFVNTDKPITIYERPNLRSFDTLPGGIGSACYPTSVATLLDFYTSASDTVRFVRYLTENDLQTQVPSYANAIQKQSEVDLQFLLPGMHDVSVYLETEYGCPSDTIKVNNYVEIPGPYAAFEILVDTTPMISYSNFACRKQSLYFRITESLNLSHGYRWHFDMDSSNRTDRTAESVSGVRYDAGQYGVYSYLEPGDKFIQLELLSDDQACVRWAPNPEENYYRSLDDKFYEKVSIQPLNAHFAPADSACGLQDSIIFTMENPGYASYYEWRFDDGSGVDTIPQTEKLVVKDLPDYGNYQVSLFSRDGDGCEDLELFPFTVHELPDNTITKGDTTICYGGSTYIALRSLPNYRYNWDPSQHLSAANIHNPLTTPQATTVYTATITDDSTSCQNEQSIQVSVQNIPRIVFYKKGDNSLIKNNRAFLPIGDTLYALAYDENEQPGVEILWDYNQTGTGDSINNLAILYPNANTEYAVTAKDSTVELYGCAPATSTLYVEVSEGSVQVPKAFTPNGDGINDILYVDGWGVHLINQFELTIYNRWGQVVFQTKNINEGWDGKYKGKIQNIDTYTYTIKVSYQNGNSLTKTGAFTLLQ